MNFTKMEGLGNDFIMLNGLKENIPQNLAEFSKKYCDRHFGIGADGVIIIWQSDIADIKMQIINSDGSEAEMCGNGIRCFAKYLYEQKIIENKKITVETLAGIIIPEIITDENNQVVAVEVDMGEPVLQGELIPTVFKQEQVVSQPIKIEEREFFITAVKP